MSTFKDPTINAMVDAVDGPKQVQHNGTEGQDREFYSDTQDRESYVPDPDDLDPEEAAFSAGPVGSYEWHKAVFFCGGDPAEEEEDAFRSGWMRALDAAQERLREATGLDLDLGRDLNLDPRE